MKLSLEEQQKLIEKYKGKSLQDLNPELAKEWDYELNEDLTPNMVNKASDIMVWWKCDKGHTYERKIKLKKPNEGCPYCKNAHTKYKGKLGEFEYDKNMFEFTMYRNIYCLRYIGKGEIKGEKIIIPQGILSCEYMFADCTSLVTAPKIPNSVTNCENMFEGCVSLVKAPKIPNSVTNCNCMFWGCKSLVEAPKLPNSVINCSNMFYSCKALTKSPSLPNSVKLSYRTFDGCSRLIQKPKTPKACKMTLFFATDTDEFENLCSINAFVNKHSWLYSNNESENHLESIFLKYKRKRNKKKL